MKLKKEINHSGLLISSSLEDALRVYEKDLYHR